MGIQSNETEDVRQMIEEIEAAESVNFSFNGATGRIRTQGKPNAVDRALERLKPLGREEVAKVLKARQEPMQEVIVRELPVAVPALAVQRSNRQIWLGGKGQYYQPTLAQDDLMWSKVEEGDLVVSDFALSFSVIKPNGLVIAIDRRGNITPPSPYSPAVKGLK